MSICLFSWKSVSPRPVTFAEHQLVFRTPWNFVSGDRERALPGLNVPDHNHVRGRPFDFNFVRSGWQMLLADVEGERHIGLREGLRVGASTDQESQFEVRPYAAEAMTTPANCGRAVWVRLLRNARRFNRAIPRSSKLLPVPAPNESDLRAAGNSYLGITSEQPMIPERSKATLNVRSSKDFPLALSSGTPGLGCAYIVSEGAHPCPIRPY
jgi:hypothetical protein